MTESNQAFKERLAAERPAPVEPRDIGYDASAVNRANAERLAAYYAERKRLAEERRSWAFDPAKNTVYSPRRRRVKNWKPGGCHYCGKNLPRPYHPDGVWGYNNAFCTTTCGLAFAYAAVVGGVKLVPVTP